MVVTVVKIESRSFSSVAVKIQHFRTENTRSVFTQFRRPKGGVFSHKINTEKKFYQYYLKNEQECFIRFKAGFPLANFSREAKFSFVFIQLVPDGSS